MKGRTASFALALAGAVLLSACNPPKYVTYSSMQKDWKAMVPWGWNVLTDQERGHYTNTTFIGPFDPEFYLGAPSLSVRWYQHSYPHRLPDGLLEMYSDADDYVKQTIETVYGPQPHMRQPVHDIIVGGRKARHFIVLSPVKVPEGTQWGTSVDVETGRLVNLREHAYVVLPLSRGFYVLVYPATRDGFKLYEAQFNQLVNTFEPLTEGPDGPKVEAPPRGAQSAAAGSL